MALPPETPLVVFGDDWGRFPSSMQHVFRHICVRYPVIWINGIGHRVPRLTRSDLRRLGEKAIRQLRRTGAPPAYQAYTGGGAPREIIEPRVLPWHHWPVVHDFNTRSLLHAIRGRLRRLHPASPPVLITGSPPSVGVVGKLGEAASIYFVMDDFLNFPTTTASMIAPLERQMLDRVDMVVGTAASLTVSKRPRSGRAIQLPQGVNYEHFASPREEPADLAVIPRPRIGFAGSVSTQIDMALLSRLIDEFPSASFVFVGGVSLDDEMLEPLRRPNVHLLGHRPYDDLPAYVQGFDVGLVPYAISSWTVAVDPLKLLEYCAAGIPVVCTALPEAAKYAGTVAVEGEAQAYLAAVGRALAGDREAQRRAGQALALEHQWDRRAQTLLDVMTDLVRDVSESRAAARTA